MEKKTPLEKTVMPIDKIELGKVDPIAGLKPDPSAPPDTPELFMPPYPGGTSGGLKVAGKIAKGLVEERPVLSDPSETDESEKKKS
jgi:hypothetical protein